MTWDYFVPFSIAALHFWGFGAFAAWRGRKPYVVGGLTLIGLAIFFCFIVGMWISLERPPMRTMGETRLWYSFFLPLAGLVLMFKEFFNTDINWLDFYNQMSGYVGIICTVAFSCSIVYLVQRYKKEELLRTGRAVEEKPEMLQSAFSVMPS